MTATLGEAPGFKGVYAVGAHIAERHGRGWRTVRHEGMMCEIPIRIATGCDVHLTELAVKLGGLGVALKAEPFGIWHGLLRSMAEPGGSLVPAARPMAAFYRVRT